MGILPENDYLGSNEISMEYFWHYDAPLGGLTLESDGEALTGIRFDRQSSPDGVSEEVPGEKMRLPVFDETCRWLDIYFSGKAPDFTPKLYFRATPFRERVWQILLTIPYGETMTYGEVAALLARESGRKRMSAQAVGGAVGHNPIPLIIPCHRVIGTGGRLVGYTPGLDKKAFLLRLEQSKL